MTHKHHDTIKPVIFRKGTDEINSNAVTSLVGDRQWVKGTMGLSSQRLIVETSFAGRNIQFFQVILHIWPVVRIMEGCIDFICTKMSEAIMSKTE